jgi:FixJ family two-component response regulator
VLWTFAGGVDILYRVIGSMERDTAKSVEAEPPPAPERMTRGTRDEVLVVGKYPLVSVIDDSESVRESLPSLLQHVGFAVQAFSSAEAFLASEAADKTGCLILDVGLPGMSGPDLQQELIRRGRVIPIVFITGRSDKSLATHLVALGAVACLYKPFSDDALLEAVETALERR